MERTISTQPVLKPSSTLMINCLFPFTSQLVLPKTYNLSSISPPIFGMSNKPICSENWLLQILCMPWLVVTWEHSLIAPGKSFSLRQQAAPFNQHETLNALASFSSSSPKDPSTLTKSAAWERKKRYHGFGTKSRTKKLLIKLDKSKPLQVKDLHFHTSSLLVDTCHL